MTTPPDRLGPGLTIGSVFRNAARATPRRPAAIVADRRLTFGELDTLADRTAHALTALGLRRGDRVLCWTGTVLDVVPVFAALARMTAVYCPLPGTLTADEAAAVLSVADPALMVVDAEHADAGRAVASAHGLPLVTIVELAVEAEQAPAEEFADVTDERDPHVIFFTSGSTGPPKGVVLSHRVNYLRSHPGSQLEPRGAMICVYPLFHMGAWTISLQQWQARDLVVYLPKPDGAAICAAVRQHGATRLNAMPALWQRVLDALDEEGNAAEGSEGGPGQLAGLRFADSGTSATPPELLERIAHACPQAFLRIFYGSTEAGNVASLTGDDIVRKPGSCGTASQATQVRVERDTGELCVRGPLLLDGYFGDPDATAAALRDGWYHTGDLASVDDEGYLRIIGRLGDVIRTGGESVVPTEVESALHGLPGAIEVAIVGLPDDTWGEIVCAVVVPDGRSRPPSLKDARQWCTGRLAPHKHPRAIRLVEALPRTPATGQLRRRQLVQALVPQQPHVIIKEDP